MDRWMSCICVIRKKKRLIEMNFQRQRNQLLSPECSSFLKEDFSVFKDQSETKCKTTYYFRHQKNLPLASECELKPSDNEQSQSVLRYDQHKPAYNFLVMSQPPPGSPPTLPPDHSSLQKKSPLEDGEQPDPEVEFVERTGPETKSIEIINLDRSCSMSPSVNNSEMSRSRDRRRHKRSRSRSGGRSRLQSKKRRTKSRERDGEQDKDRQGEEECDKERERRKRCLPPIKKEHLSVCSTTLWVGRVSKLVYQEDLCDTFGEYGDIVSIDMIPPRGCAFICMNRRQDADRALQKLKYYKLQGKPLVLAWAPGKGLKGKEWKDYWEVELGVAYIPWSKLNRECDLNALEEGGMIDEETVPQWMKQNPLEATVQKTNYRQSNECTEKGTVKIQIKSEQNSPPVTSDDSVQELQDDSSNRHHSFTPIFKNIQDGKSSSSMTPTSAQKSPLFVLQTDQTFINNNSEIFDLFREVYPFTIQDDGVAESSQHGNNTDPNSRENGKLTEKCSQTDSSLHLEYLVMRIVDAHTDSVTKILNTQNDMFKRLMEADRVWQTKLDSLLKKITHIFSNKESGEQDIELNCLLDKLDKLDGSLPYRLLEIRNRNQEKKLDSLLDKLDKLIPTLNP